jgi:glycosyltransferase involved in cell wall biosynthesis
MRLLFNANVAWFFISHRLEIARAARDSGYEVHVSADFESPEEATVLEREGLRFHRVRLRRGGLNFVGDLRYFMELSRIIREVQPDLVHNVTVKPVVYGTVAARRRGVRRVVNAVSGLGYAFAGGESRRLLSGLVKTAYRAALHRPEVRVIFQNEDDVRTFVDAGIVETNQAVLIKGSGVDLSAFAFTPEPAGNPIVVLPARMLRDKGVLEFADAARMLRAAGCKAEFMMAGRADTENPAGLGERELARLEGETGVRWLGHVSDMPSLLRRSHIVCLPSYREGLPKSLLEACAAGRPIITTDVPGCREAVRNGENGLLVEPRNAGALAAAIRRLVEDANLRRSMGRAGRNRAEAEFDVGKVVSATLGLYEDMLS